MKVRNMKKDFLVFITRKRHDTSLHYEVFARQAQDDLHACLDAWYTLKHDFPSMQEEDWVLLAYELPDENGPHLIRRR